MQNSDKQNARIEHDKAAWNVIVGLMKDDTEFVQTVQRQPEFKRWLADAIFSATYDRPATTLPECDAKSWPNDRRPKTGAGIAAVGQ